MTRSISVASSLVATFSSLRNFANTWLKDPSCIAAITCLVAEDCL